MITSDKGKPDQSQGRKTTGPRFLRDAFSYATKDPKIAGLPRNAMQMGRFSLICKGRYLRDIDADGGTWSVFAGTGKYEGATGDGTWEFGELWPDGKIENNWRGEIILK